MICVLQEAAIPVRSRLLPHPRRHPNRLQFQIRITWLIRKIFFKVLYQLRDYGFTFCFPLRPIVERVIEELVTRHTEYTTIFQFLRKWNLGEQKMRSERFVLCVPCSRFYTVPVLTI